MINKPCGLAVQGGAGISESVDRILPEQTKQNIHLVHRLDKETAGVLVTAKSAAAASKWISLLQSGLVKKEYAALSFGRTEPLSGRIDSPVVHKGKSQSALTFYRTSSVFTVLPESEENSPGGCFSLFYVTLGTGRMHQIRMHLAQKGVPIIADDKYGNFKMNKEAQKKLHIKKLQLAAVRLTVPVEGKNRTFEIELPPHMQNALDEIQKISEVQSF